MVIRIIMLAVFAAVFFVGTRVMPQMLGFRKSVLKNLEMADGKDVKEYGDINTLVVSQETVTDESGEVSAEAIEIVTMLGRTGIETVLVSTGDEAEGDEIARRLGAVRTFCKTEDYMKVVEELELAGKKVLYTEDLWAAEEAIDLGNTVQRTIKINAIWTVLCGAAAVILAENYWAFAFAGLNLAVLGITALKIKKE